MNSLLRLFSLLIISFSLQFASASLNDIDTLIKNNHSHLLKEEKIADLKRIANSKISQSAKLNTLEQLIYEYQHFVYDSALYYANTLLLESDRAASKDFQTKALIHKALLLLTGDFLDEAENIFQQIPLEDIPADARENYYNLAYDLAKAKRNNSSDRRLKRSFSSEMESSITHLVEISDKNSAPYFFYLGKRLLEVDNNKDAAFHCFVEASSRSPQNSEIFLISALHIADYYMALNNQPLYEEWLMKAAQAQLALQFNDSDALARLAILLFQNNSEDISRASNYLTVARKNQNSFYPDSHNDPIAKSLPDIIPVYLEKIKRKDSQIYFLISLAVVLFLLGGLISFVIFIQKKKLLSKEAELIDEREKIKGLNYQLFGLSDHLEENQRKISDIPREISLTRQKGNKLTKVWIDILLMLEHKEKSPLSDEKGVDNSIKKNQDPTLLLRQFDVAFLALFPDFIVEINKLLKDNLQFDTNKKVLSTELRICALINLGIKESSDMAALLFTSVQTIYNNRTKLRNRAIDKQQFEKSVALL
ncbi:MAG: hypothetical protein J1F38_03215 [Muribaculaceae bacterium]|nr:hypothetical protein [Muribaculaceae bacterium]